MSQDYIDEAGKRMAQEIDFSILADTLVESGWVKVVLKPMTWEDGYEIDNWVETNIKGKFETMGLVWLFEHPQEATWFTLRWLNG